MPDSEKPGPPGPAPSGQPKADTKGLTQADIIARLASNPAVLSDLISLAGFSDPEKSFPPGTVPSGQPSDDTRGLKQDDIIGRLVPDPAALPDLISLAGFLGRSTRPKFWRLYSGVDLKDFVEIAEADIVLSQPLAMGPQSSSGTVIWVRSGARVNHTKSGSQPLEADFLQGDITQTFLPGTAPLLRDVLSPAAAANSPGLTKKLWCWSYRPHCTKLLFCTLSCTNFSLDSIA